MSKSCPRNPVTGISCREITTHAPVTGSTTWLPAHLGFGLQSGLLAGSARLSAHTGAVVVVVVIGMVTGGGAVVVVVVDVVVVDVVVVVSLGGGSHSQADAGICGAVGQVWCTQGGVPSLCDEIRYDLG